MFPAGIFRGSVRGEIESQRRGRCGGGWSGAWEADSAGYFRRARGVAADGVGHGRQIVQGTSGGRAAWRRMEWGMGGR